MLSPSRRTFLRTTAIGTAAAGALPYGSTAAAGDTLPHGSTAAAATQDGMRTEREWAAFLAGSDLRWKHVPVTFYEGPFLGNGAFGAAVYRHPSRQRLTFVLGDSRVRDHQDNAGGAVFGHSRLRIGYLTLETAGDVTGVDLRLSLWDAELSGTVTTTAGTVTLRAFTHATRDLLVVNAVADGGETVAWSFTPFPAESPRLAFKPRPAGLRDNPAPVVTEGRCVQDLVAGGRTTTAWRVNGPTLIATVAHTFPDTTASDVAARCLRRAGSLDRLTQEHRDWWHRLYPKSFVSLPDARLQSFYWIQLYKMACATRADRPVISTTAQWLEPTPWPGTWWNLNVQLEYWLINATGHTELDSLTHSLDQRRANLDANTVEPYRADSAGIGRVTQEDLRSDALGVPGQTGGDFAVPETGNLTWALHNVWLRYRHTMDDGLLRHVLFPLLRRAIGYYLHFLQEGPDGRLHLPETYSPEYATTRDCNYDLALLTWGCHALLDAAARLKIDDPLTPRWRDVLNRLVPPPQGADGLWIGADKQLTSSHRHFSHLLWFHPLHVLDVNDLASRDLLRRSLAHWLSLPGALQGYTFTGAASMSALLADGDAALGYLNTLLTTYVKPNTMYAESGPVIETPLSGAQSLHDMLLQSWGGTIRVFPAIPSAWADVAMQDLRAEGAFLVTAAQRGGRTVFVRIRSLAGEPCRLVPGGMTGPYAVLRGGRPAKWRESGGVLEIELRRGEEVLVHPRGIRPDTHIGPVQASTAPPWGLP